MTCTFPSHARANFERTDGLLHEIKGIALAFDALHDGHPEPDPNSNQAIAKAVLLRVLLERLEALDRVRAMEWCGMGGKSERLTPADIAIASGTEINHFKK